MLMQNFGVTNEEHYGMLWYFLEWSIGSRLYYKRDTYGVTLPARACVTYQILTPWIAGTWDLDH